MTMLEDCHGPLAGDSPVDRWVGRQAPKRDNVSAGGAERASESDSRHPADGDPYTTARAHYTPRGCHECAWGKVLGCWRCGGR